MWPHSITVHADYCTMLLWSNDSAYLRPRLGVVVCLCGNLSGCVVTTSDLFKERERNERGRGETSHEIERSL